MVYAVRRQRKEGPIKRLCYFLFYRIMNAISDIDIPLDSGDFCLMDRKVVKVLVGLPEKMRFVRGLRTFVGFKQTGLEYERAAREAGKPKYTLRSLIVLAIDGLVSFSGYPLRLSAYVGVATAFAAVLVTGWVLIDALANHTAPRGWASVMATILFVGSIQLIGLGVVGEYIRLIFLESKRRPMYIVGEYRPMRSTSAEGHREAEAPIEAGQEVADMIHHWSEGVADHNMTEDILVELGSLIHRHPWWRARARLTQELLRRLGVSPPARVLDVGCGWGITLEALEQTGYRATGTDISRMALERLDRPGRELVEMDLTKPLPVEAVGGYDAVLALDVIEHLDDDRAAVAGSASWHARADSWWSVCRPGPTCSRSSTPSRGIAAGTFRTP